MNTALLPSSDSQRLPNLDDDSDFGELSTRSGAVGDDLSPPPLVEEAQSWDSGAILTALTDLDIEFHCQACDRAGRVPRAWAGGRVRCGRCRRPVRLPSARTAGFADAQPRYGKVRRRFPARDLQHEGHVRAVALWHCLAGVAGTLLAPAVSPSLGSTLALVAASALVWFTGQLLWNLSPVGRMGALCLSTSLAFGVAVGAVSHPVLPGVLAVLLAGGWAAGVVWALLGRASRELFRRDYRAGVDFGGEASIPWSSSPLFYLPAGLLLGSGVGLWLLI